MTNLVVYYSRTGNNRTIAETIASKLSADIDEIVNKKNGKADSTGFELAVTQGAES